MEWGGAHSSGGSRESCAWIFVQGPRVPSYATDGQVWQVCLVILGRLG